MSVSVVELRTTTDDQRERIAVELEDAARRVRTATGRPTACGIVVVIAGMGDSMETHVYTAHEGRDLLRLMAGCAILARRIDDSLDCVDAPPDEGAP